MIQTPDVTTINTSEYKPDAVSIGFAPELIQFIKDNQKLTTYRFGRKYDHFKVGDVINYQDSQTGQTVGRLRVTGKHETTFASLPLDNPTHEAYKDKEHQRKVLSGYYAFIGRELRDDDLFLVFDFELIEDVSGTEPHLGSPVIIVDQTDTPIGIKERATLTHNDIYRVSALWLTNSKSQVLLAQRKWSKKNDPGKWGPAVAGTVDEGETYEQNIHKEAEEEIGLTDTPFKTGPKHFVDDGLHRFFVQWFTTQVDHPLESFTLQEDQVEQLAWVDKQTLLDELDTTPEKFVANASSWKIFL